MVDTIEKYHNVVYNVKWRLFNMAHAEIYFNIDTEQV